MRDRTLPKGGRGVHHMPAHRSQRGAPGRRPGEAGAVYIRRLQDEGWLRPPCHPSNHVFTGSDGSGWGDVARASRPADAQAGRAVALCGEPAHVSRAPGWVPPCGLPSLSTLRRAPGSAASSSALRVFPFVPAFIAICGDSAAVLAVTQG